MSALISVKVNGVWKTPGKPDIVDPINPGNNPPTWVTETNPAWKLLPNETTFDNAPAGVPIVKASDYSTSRDLYTVLQAVATTAGPSCYVQLDATVASVYTISDFKQYGTADWRGWTNGTMQGGTRRVMGLIGYGNRATKIRVEPGAINASPGLRDYILSMTSKQGPVPAIAIYFSNSSTSAPIFISGICFDGTLQGPYGVYSTGAQGQFTRNQTTPSPLAWSGMSLWGGTVGGRIQFCEFRGFGYALLNAPSFECGAYQHNYGIGFVEERNELDGRIAAEYDASRPLASGGWMWNKSIKTVWKNSHEHHTRRSGSATNTNTGRTDEVYIQENIQVHDITGLDGFASNSAGFPGANIEAVVGTFTFTNCYFNITNGSAHINLNIPYSGAPGVYTVPDRPIVYVTNFRTDDTAMGGCLRIYVAKTPNSTGTSPAWQKITDKGIAGANLFDIRLADGTPLIGIKSTNFNPAVHKPTTHYVVIY